MLNDELVQTISCVDCAHCSEEFGSEMDLLTGTAGKALEYGKPPVEVREASFKGEAHVLNAHVILEGGIMELPPDVG